MIKRYVCKLLNGMADAALFHPPGEQFVPAADFDRAVALLRAVQDDVMIREHDSSQQKEARQMWSDIDAFLTAVDRTGEPDASL